MTKKVTKSISIESVNGQISALLRSAKPENKSSTVVIICPGIGTDYNNAYRSMRHLALGIAENGIDCLSFDYLSTGNSCDGPSELTLVEKLEHSVNDVVDYARAHYQSVILIGFRFGASLAAKYSASNDVDGLVLWSPVLKGHGFIREIKLLENSSGTSHQPVEHIELSGLIFQQRCQEQLKTIDLFELQPKSNNVLCILDNKSKKFMRLIELWSEKNKGQIESVETDETESLLVDAHLAGISQDTNNHIIATIKRWSGDQSYQRIDISAEETRVRVEGDISEYHCLNDLGYSIHCKPTLSTNNSTVLFLSSGTNPISGPHRLYVELSRRLAKEGIQSFRVDMPGVGETEARDPASENLPYMPGTIDFLERFCNAMRLNNSKLVLVGLCSGAFHAFKAAAESSNLPVHSILSINPLTYYWEDGMTIDDSPSVSFYKWKWYMESAKDLKRWKKLLTGQVKLKPLLDVLVKRIGVQLELSKQSVQQRVVKQSEHFEVDRNISKSLNRIKQLNRKIHFIFSQRDPGLDIINASSKRTLSSMRKEGFATVSVIADADHTFSRKKYREALFSAVLDSLKQTNCRRMG